MRSSKIRSYIVLSCFLLLLISLPVSVVSRWKGAVASLASPLQAIGETSLENKQSEIAILEQENRALREELQQLQEQFFQENWVGKQIERLKELRTRDVEDSYWKEFFARRAKQLAMRLEGQLLGIPAKVIFREPSFWNSHIWINVGSADNDALGFTVVGKNSVIVVRNQLIGVVEEVTQHRSRVRLITDTQLVPAVRAIRGEQNHRRFLEFANQLLEMLYVRRGLYGTPIEEKQAIDVIEKLISSTSMAWGDHYLAKGELSGSSTALWRSKRLVLQGKGFNYDFADEEGPARELRSGGILGGPASQSISLLLPGDLLVTSGLDGVFPPGLEVAMVTKVGLLREGASTYDLEAIPGLSDLDDLKEVWVFPPMPQ
ncbi:MAG: hypothetical protein KGZ39_06805 [Simkania sp.]|nr:hypothetical protein [Simkania sp.]